MIPKAFPALSVLGFLPKVPHLLLHVALLAFIIFFRTISVRLFLSTA